MNKDIITLTIPSKPDYISVVRLTTSSICNSMGFNIEDIEDIKVSISEACINALNKSEKINIIYKIEEDRLIVNIDNVHKDYGKEVNKEMKLGLLIIESLMDNVNFSEKGVEMIKYIEDGIR